MAEPAPIVSPTGGSAPPAAPEGAEDDLIDQLESLGYIDVSEDEADPGKMGVTVHDASRAFPGFNLFCMKSQPRADLLDMNGVLVHQWTEPRDEEWTSCRMDPDGSLVVVGLRGSRDGQRNDRHRFIARYAWDGTPIWRKDGAWTHHETATAANGDVLALALAYRGMPKVYTEGKVRDDVLLRIDAKGEVVQRISLLEVMRGASPRLRIVPPPPIKKWGIRQVDLIHANTVEILEGATAAAHPVLGAGQVLITSRHQHTVFAFDLVTQQVSWSWGRGNLMRPHEGILLDNGNVLIFDNGGEKRPVSRVVEVRPTGPRTAEVVRMWPAKPTRAFYSASRGGAQPLSNGNLLVTNSNDAHVLELDPQGRVVWEFWNPELVSSGRRRTFRKMRRVPRDWTPLGG